MEQTECSETSAYKIQKPENYPEESMQRSEHGESLKSRKHQLPLLYLKPIHALILNTLSHPHFKILKLLKNVL
jgi:hypothetical protein